VGIAISQDQEWRISFLAQRAVETVNHASIVTTKWAIGEVEKIIKSYILATSEKAFDAHTKAQSKKDAIIRACSRTKQFCQDIVEDNEGWNRDTITAVYHTVCGTQYQSMKAAKFFCSLRCKATQTEVWENIEMVIRKTVRIAMV
jgi:ribosomal protein L17